MSDHPFFTVITPVYNRSEIVVETILSVLNQQFSDFEYILINDASTDDSLKVLNAFAQQDQRIRVIDLKQNEGRCFARNQGLKNAKGDWICYLDSDDLYYTDHLSTMYNSIKENADFKAFAVDQHINSILKKYRRSELHKDRIILTLGDFIEDNPLTANQLCHAREIPVSWSDERIPISEDWLFLRTIVNSFPIFKRAHVTNNLRDHSERSMNTADSSSFVKYNLLASKKFIRENNISKEFQSRIEAYTLVLCVNVLLKHKQKKAAFRLFKKCLKLSRSYRYSIFYKAIFKFFL